MATVEVHTRRVMATTTLRVRLRGMTELRFRTWVSIGLMKLAAVVLGTGFSITWER